MKNEQVIYALGLFNYRTKYSDLDMKLKYINIASVHKLIGSNTPFSVKFFAQVIEEGLSNINEGWVATTSKRRFRSKEVGFSEDVSKIVEGIADKLLKHNMSNKQNCWDMLAFDMDITCPYDDKNKTIETYINPYFSSDEHSRSPHHHRVVYHLNFKYEDGTQWNISFPIQAIMKGWGDVEDGYMCYSHSITLIGEDKEQKDIGSQHIYCGITKRNWLKKMSEHFSESRSGGNKTFHRAWREYQGRSGVLFWSELITLNHSYQGAMDWEEEQVDITMETGSSLNMIPGGFKGMKFLYKHRITDREKIEFNERDKAITRYAKENPRLGIPNLIISELWRDDEYASNIICQGKNRLNIEQVREIRNLNDNGIPIEKIIKKVNASSLLQVQNALERKTYSRIH